MTLFANIRVDYDRHGRSLRNRALWALCVYRFGRWALAMPAVLRWPLGKVYGLLQVFTPMITGVAMDRTTTVGHRFHIVHPGMVLIHPDVRIGDRVGLMHGVTLGVGSKTGSDGVPTLGDDTFIGAHATLLGPVTVGAGAQVAANSLLITDVPAGGFAIGVPAKVYPPGSPAARMARGESLPSPPLVKADRQSLDAPKHHA